MWSPGSYEHTIRQQLNGYALRSVVLNGRAPQIALGILPAHAAPV